MVDDAANELTLADVVAFFRRNLKLIGGFVLAFGIVASVVLLLVVKKQYEASVTLVIVPPKLASELKPQSLSVQSYQQILESDAVLEETRTRLAEKGYIPSRMDFQIGRALRTKIFVLRQREDIALAPMLQAIVHAPSPKEAATTANIWAEVFLHRVRELVAGSTSASVQFVEQQYPSVRDDLAKAEEERVALSDKLQKHYDEVSTSWDARLVAFKGETADKTGAFKSETDRLLREFASEHSLDTRREQLKALRKAYADLQDEQARVSSQLQDKQLRLAGIKAALDKTPQFLTLHKAISDDALWQTIGGDKGDPDWKALQGRALTTQQANPVYEELAGRAATVETDVAALAPRGAQLDERLAALSKDMKTLEVSLTADEAQSEKLKNTRAAGLTRLEDTRAAGLDSLQRQRDQALSALKLDMNAQLGRVDRTITQEKDLFTQLAKSFNQATMAKGQLDFEDVRVGAPAVANSLPLRRGRLWKAALAAFAGGLVGIGVAVVRDADREARGHRSAHAAPADTV
jgi:capsular polysaccharide biosynthesis protein